MLLVLSLKYQRPSHVADNGPAGGCELAGSAGRCLFCWREMLFAGGCVNMHRWPLRRWAQGRLLNKHRVVNMHRLANLSIQSGFTLKLEVQSWDEYSSLTMINCWKNNRDLKKRPGFRPREGMFKCYSTFLIFFFKIVLLVLKLLHQEKGFLS